MDSCRFVCTNKTDEGRCSGELKESSSGRMPVIEIGDRVQYGSLACSSCGSEFPVIDFVPVLIPKAFYYLRNNFSIIDSYLKYIGRPFPSEIRKSLYSIFLEQIKSPNEPVIPNRKGYEDRFMDGVMSRFRTYYESHMGMEWDSDMFSIGKIETGSKNTLYKCVNSLIKRYCKEDYGRSLDIGSNLGGYTFLLSGFSANSCGLDTSFEAIHSASISADKQEICFSHGAFDLRKPLKYRKKPSFFVSEAENIPFDSGSIDFSLALNMVDIVADPELFMTELARIMKRGGAVILSTPFIESSKSVSKLRSINENEIEALKILAREKGFTLQEEIDDILWRLNEYSRKIVLYKVYLAVLVKD